MVAYPGQARSQDFSLGGRGGLGERSELTLPTQRASCGRGLGAQPPAGSRGGAPWRSPLAEPLGGAPWRSPLAEPLGGAPWRSPLAEPLGGAPWRSPLAEPLGGAPWRSPLAEPLGGAPWRSPLAEPLGGAPWRSPLAEPLGGAPWRSPLAEPLGGAPWRSPLAEPLGGAPWRSPLAEPLGGGLWVRSPVTSPVTRRPWGLGGLFFSGVQFFPCLIWVDMVVLYNYPKEHRRSSPPELRRLTAVGGFPHDHGHERLSIQFVTKLPNSKCRNIFRY